jgi:hypothetical protein
VAPSSNSSAQIGHGGIGQFGEFYGDIHVEAGRSISILAGEATRATASIGHTFVGHAYWNPTNVVDQQLRFFATAGDFDNPNLRRGELFSGAITTGFNPALDPERTRRYNLANFPDNGVNAGGFAINTTLGYSVNQYSRGTSQGAAGNQGLLSLAPLDLAPTGLVTVAALNGSTISGLHGNINATARTGDIVVKGYSTQGVTGTFARDRRFAAIGHGGTNNNPFGTEGSGYRNLLNTPTVPTINGNIDGRENVSYRMLNGNELQTGSSTFVGDSGGNMNRHLVFMTITGDIDVNAPVGSLLMTAGNDIHDYSRLGHGGTELADYETSSFILGDIRVNVGGNLDLIGGGSVAPLNRTGNFDVLAPAHLGHGGYRSGFTSLQGDIQLTTGGNVLVRNGAYALTHAKIGHQAFEDRGQVGGNFSRTENFRFDNVQTNIVSLNTAAAASVAYSAALVQPNNVVGSRDFTNGQA